MSHSMINSTQSLEIFAESCLISRKFGERISVFFLYRSITTRITTRPALSNIERYQQIKHLSIRKKQVND